MKEVNFGVMVIMAIVIILLVVFVSLAGAQTQVTVSVEHNPCSDALAICEQYKAEHNIR